jgi:hypothetical protein
VLGLSEKNQDGLGDIRIAPKVTDRLQRAGKSRISWHPIHDSRGPAMAQNQIRAVSALTLHFNSDAKSQLRPPAGGFLTAS